MGDTHIGKPVELLDNFDPQRSPKRYQDPVSSPPKDTNISYILSQVIIFRLGILKGIAKAPALELLRLNNLRATETSFLIPKSDCEFMEKVSSVAIFFRLYVSSFLWDPYNIYYVRLIHQFSFSTTRLFSRCEPTDN